LRRAKIAANARRATDAKISCLDVIGTRERENALMTGAYETVGVYGNLIQVAPLVLPAYGSAIWVSNIG
jgi:hypothetical protein